MINYSYVYYWIVDKRVFIGNMPEAAVISLFRDKYM